MSDKDSKKSSTSRDAAVRPYVNKIAKPLAKVELCEKLFKAVKKGKCVRRNEKKKKHERRPRSRHQHSVFLSQNVCFVCYFYVDEY